MGIRLFNRSASTYEPQERIRKPKPLPNPDPNNYQIISTQQIGSTLIIEILYPDCENYEGRKIMLYKNTTLDDLKTQGSIDPHFCNNPNKKSPFLRIEPTIEGWDMAIHIAVRIEEANKKEPKINLEELLECPNCGSGDVRFCNISVRPYCEECKYWAPVNYGAAQDAIKKWNTMKSRFR